MVILHIASISENPTAGVSCVVPQYVFHHSKIVKTALLNLGSPLKNSEIKELEVPQKLSIENLEEPFSSPDIVIFHEVYYPLFLGLAKELKKKNIPYIVIPHGCLTKRAQSIKKLKKTVANKLLFNSFIKNATKIQFLSKREKTESEKFDCNGVIFPNGASLPEIKKETFSKDKTKFIFIGRLSIEIKGLDLLLDAIVSISDFLKEHNCVFELYGPEDNNSFEKINSVIEKNELSDIVKVCDPVFSKEKENAILSADYYILTSRSEGHPLGVIEALSYGLSCLVSKGTGMAEIIDEYSAGFGFETDSDSIAKAIKTAVLTKDNLQEKSENAIKLVEENYLWNKISEEEILYYKKLISK